MGLRYHLDDLGWFQFEQLMQALFKAELGIGVESWGGRSDYGRDAYSRGPLNFPSRAISSDGPFVFQVKFVENANAAGSDYRPRIIQAAREEGQSIINRSALGYWTVPKHYGLYTNAPLSAAVRTEVVATLAQVMPGVTVSCFGGTDICDLLDNNRVLRKSFPQLLSLRDLQELLLDAVNKETLERSRAAIFVAQDVVSVFVPTPPYNKAWSILAKHHFAVLEGPPEMGKTAIAWMIALAQVSQGWEAIVCDHPQDFFRVLDTSKQQVFVADDAFGSTEYDPSRGSEWERQIHRVYRFLDSRHWLIWTSRKHILERASRAMDLQADAIDFPNPAAVLVSTSQLTEQDKALILYRHARAKRLEGLAKEIIKTCASSIVRDPSFTPERIKRFVVTSLPALAADMSTGKVKPETVRDEIRDAIRNATDRTRKTFRALNNAHKWFLISLLEAGPNAKQVELSYMKCCPESERRPFHEVLEELGEAFIKRDISKNADRIDWLHPSYRDLVIEELVTEPVLKRRFLEHMSIGGIKLALSDSGGAAGTRKLPLLDYEEDWCLLEQRAVKLVAEQHGRVVEILHALTGSVALSMPEIQEWIPRILRRVCEAIRVRWAENLLPVSRFELESYFDASLIVTPLPPPPPLKLSWETTVQKLDKAMEASGTTLSSVEIDLVEEWSELCKLLTANEPRYLKQQGFPGKYEMLVGRIRTQAKAELQGDLIFDDDYDGLTAESQRLRTFSDSLSILARLFAGESEELGQLASELDSKARELESEAEEREEREAEESYGGTRGPSVFDIQSLFEDL